MKASRSILFFLFLAFCFTNCKKYPEGPLISFRTKMNRITNGNWGINKYLVNGADSTQSLLSRVSCDRPIAFYKPKAGSSLCGYGCANTSVDGIWGFSGDKNKLAISGNVSDTAIHTTYPPIFISNNWSEQWNIIRLTQKQLWVKAVLDNVEYYMELKR